MFPSINLRSLKTQFIIFLSVFAIFLAAISQEWVFLATTLTTVFFACLTEAIIQYVKFKKIGVTESSIITGLIVGFVFASTNSWLVLIAAPAIAILAKHFIRYQARHIFNPAAFGLFVSLILLGAHAAWHGAFVWYVLIPFGLYFIYKFKKLEVLFGYAIVSVILFGLATLFYKGNLLHIFGYFNYFFIFVMLIEPKTTPTSTLGKWVFGMGVAGLVFVLSTIGARVDVELASLLIFNAMVPWLNKL